MPRRLSVSTLLMRYNYSVLLLVLLSYFCFFFFNCLELVINTIMKVYENQEKLLAGARTLAASIAANSPLVVQVLISNSCSFLFS